MKGKIIANKIYNENGTIYLKEGNTLTKNIIKRLHNMGLNSIYIKDENEENDLVLQEVLNIQSKLSVIKKLFELFKLIEKNKFVDYALTSKIVDEIIENINISENAIILNNYTSNNELYNFCNHSLNVALVSAIIGSNKKYDIKKLFNLIAGALLHDIGKLIKDYKKHHTEIGYELLKQNSMFKLTTYTSVLHHHEFDDGSGPLKLKKDNIYEMGKIINISDMYINHIFNGLLPHEAIEKITSLGLNKIDVEIYKTFVNSINAYPNGLKVKLNNGQEGLVIMQNKGIPSRPVVRIGNKGNYKYINLEKELTLIIEEVII